MPDSAKKVMPSSSHPLSSHLEMSGGLGLGGGCTYRLIRWRAPRRASFKVSCQCRRHTRLPHTSLRHSRATRADQNVCATKVGDEHSRCRGEECHSDGTRRCRGLSCVPGRLHYSSRRCCARETPDLTCTRTLPPRSRRKLCAQAKPVDVRAPHGLRLGNGVVRAGAQGARGGGKRGCSSSAGGGELELNTARWLRTWAE